MLETRYKSLSHRVDGIDPSGNWSLEEPYSEQLDLRKLDGMQPWRLQPADGRDPAVVHLRKTLRPEVPMTATWVVNPIRPSEVEAAGVERVSVEAEARQLD